MNEQTFKLLNELSQKLGVSFEFLWKVLVKQGPISGTIELFVMGLFLLSAWISFDFIKRKTEDDESFYCVFILWGVYAGIIILFCGCCISDSISYIINPEYFALKKITYMINPK